VLATHEQRQAIADLRKHAPMGVEDDLGAGLMPFEAKRDEVGVVNAFYRGSKLLATLRLVPSGQQLSGQRLTAAECVPGGIAEGAGILGPGNWEVGRLIVAPEERSPELLQRCLTMALHTLIEMREVEHFYAIATPVMARLWRRFGMHPTAPLCGASGRKFILVSGHVSEVASCLEVPLAERDTLCAARPQPVERMALAA
jgi:predicted GNAT family N-acyltransferase